MTHDPVPHADRDHSEQPSRYAQGGMIEGHAFHVSVGCAWHTGPCPIVNAPTPSMATAGSDPTQGTSRPVSAREVRASEAQQVAAMDALDCGAYQNRRGVVVCVNEHHEHHGPWTERGCPVAAAVADAVVAAGVDADEVTRLRAEVERWAEKAQEAGAAYANANSKHHAELDRANRLERLADTLAEKAVDLEDRARAAEAERDEIAGRLSALLCELTGGRLSKTTYDVRTMVQEIDSVYDDAHQEDRAERERLAEVVARVEALADEPGWPSDIIRAICAALSGPSPAQTPATDAPQGPGATNEAPGQSEPTCGGCGATWPDLHVYHPGPGGTLCVKCGWTPDDGTPTAAAAEDAEGHSGTGQALGGAEKGVPSIGDTCCGKCSGGTCYVDGVTGA